MVNLLIKLIIWIFKCKGIEYIPPPPKPKNKYLWLINSAHGKLQSGYQKPYEKCSPLLEDGTRFHEFEMSRKIALGLMKRLKKRGLDYVDIMPDHNEKGVFRDRVVRGNEIESKLTKVWISPHLNAAPTSGWDDAGITGYETWRGRSELAEVFHKHIIEQTGWKDRGIKDGSHFFEIRDTEMDAILFEFGFYNNREDLKKILDPITLVHILDALELAILEIEGLDATLT